MTITLTREEAQQVLDALIWTLGSDDFSEAGKARTGAVKLLLPAIETLRARLSAPEPEPAKLLLIPALMEQAGWVRKREWQGLTDEELNEIYNQDGLIYKPLKFYRAIEAKLKEKNT